MPERSADAVILALMCGIPNEKTLNEAENDAITRTAWSRSRRIFTHNGVFSYPSSAPERFGRLRRTAIN
jgi:hypothetical protein